MNALFIANIQLLETEGIYKKVKAQALAIGQITGSCKLLTRTNASTRVNVFYSGKSVEESKVINKKILSYACDLIKNDNIKLIYIRHMIPSLALIKLLELAKSKNIRINYEIPTYPYYAEQFKTSRCKPRAIAKLSLDTMFWPIIYHYIDKLIIIKSNSKVNIYNKMFEITNGVETKNIAKKSYEKDRNDKVFRMVGVGTLYPYHGYDRLLKGLAACHERVGDVIIETNIVGKSQTIDDLKVMVRSLNLKHVVFHGIKTTEELNKMYDNFDVGLGCLALHRRNADIDTTLKIIEYYCRGVPVITSGKSPLVNDNSKCSYTIQVIDNEDPIEIASIYNSYKKYTCSELEQLSQMAKEQFSWITIMKKCIL